MSITKACGRIAEYRGENNVRIEVLLFKRNGENITNPNEIKLQFPPYGYVFAPKFRERFDYQLDELIEFHISTWESSLGDVRLIDIDKECKPAGYPLVYVTSNILIHDQSILQPILRDLIQHEYSHFYIQYKDFAYGPFKTQKNEIVPRSAGMTVYKYSIKDQPYTYQERHYFLQEPREVVGIVDCMTQTQLANFLKDQIRKLNLGYSISELKRLLETQSFDDLDAARIHRIAYSLEKLEVGGQILKDLADHSTSFQILYKQELQNIKDELRLEHVQPLLELKTSLSKEISDLSTNTDQAKREYLHYQQALEASKIDYDRIVKEKTRLIEDIKLHVLVKGANSDDGQALLTYEELVYQPNGSLFANLQEFVQPLQESFHTNENGGGRLAQHIVYQLKDYSCFLTHNIEPVLQLARLSNNCKVIIQQVEPDWLKFERFYQNGLQQIWASAHEHKSMLHFLILEDINMASIECYGRPMLDLLSGVRQKLPGVQTSWPKNLWVFGMPVSRSLRDDFGLPLLKATFKHWGYIPLSDSLNINQKASTDKVLPLAHLFDNDAIIPSFINDYFQEL